MQTDEQAEELREQIAAILNDCQTITTDTCFKYKNDCLRCETSRILNRFGEMLEDNVPELIDDDGTHYSGNGILQWVKDTSKALKRGAL